MLGAQSTFSRSKLYTRKPVGLPLCASYKAAYIGLSPFFLIVCGMYTHIKACSWRARERDFFVWLWTFFQKATKGNEMVSARDRQPFFSLCAPVAHSGLLGEHSVPLLSIYFPLSAYNNAQQGVEKVRRMAFLHPTNFYASALHKTLPLPLS